MVRLPALAAAAANIIIALAKLAAFFITGSAAMLTESFHSMVDTCDQGLLLLGDKLSQRPPDALHPFGYGMEQYFWSFVIAILIFALGGAASVYEGVERLIAPEPIRQPWVSFAVIGVALLFEGGSFLFAVRSYRKHTKTPLGLSAFQHSKNPSVFVIIFEDAAALIGLLFASLGVGATTLLKWPYGDGAASIAIGLLLVATALTLASETRSLLLGEAASPKVLKAIREAALANKNTRYVGKIFSLHLGPDKILAAVTLRTEDFETGAELRETVRRIETSVRAVDDRIGYVFFSPAKEGDAESAPAATERPSI